MSADAGGAAAPSAALTLTVRRTPNAAAPDPIDPPSYATAGAAGLDLQAAVRAPVRLAPGARALIPTGFAMAIPRGFEGQVRPRSGWAARAGVTVLNAPGTIDADYRGEVQVLLINLGDAPVVIERGDRIAQLVVAAAPAVAVAVVGELDATPRGAGGFGHTGR